LGKAPSTGIRTLGALFKPQFPMMLRGFLWLVLTNLSALAVPRLVNIGIDVVEGRSATLSLGAVVALIAGLAVIGGIVRTRSRIVLFNAGRDVERSLRQELFAHLATLSSTYFGKSSTGDLMSRLTNDLTNIRLLAGFALLNAANGILVVVVTRPRLQPSADGEGGDGVEAARQASRPVPLASPLGHEHRREHLQQRDDWRAR